MSKRTGLTEKTLKDLYVKLGKTDREIADFFEVDRTAIVKLRKSFGIYPRTYTGSKGEECFKKELINRGISFVDLNETDKTSPYDFLIENKIRIDVKSAVVGKNGCWNFVLTEKSQLNNVESDCRIRLKNGRTKKLYRKTCDFLVLVTFGNGEIKYFMIPSTKIDDKKQTISVGATSKSKFYIYRENWDVFSNKKQIKGE